MGPLEIISYQTVLPGRRWNSRSYLAIQNDAQRLARKGGDTCRQGSRQISDLHLAILRMESVK